MQYTSIANSHYTIHTVVLKLLQSVNIKHCTESELDALHLISFHITLALHIFTLRITVSRDLRSTLNVQ